MYNTIILRMRKLLLKKMDLRKKTHIRAPPLTNGRILIYFEKKLTIRYQDTNRHPTLRASEGRAAESNKFSDRKRVASCRNWYCSHACSSSSLHNFWSTFITQFSPRFHGCHDIIQHATPRSQSADHWGTFVPIKLQRWWSPSWPISWPVTTTDAGHDYG